MRRRAVLRAVAGLAGSAGVAGTVAGARSDATAAEPYAPLGRVEIPGATEAVVGDDGTTVYVAAMDGFAVVDVSDPADPAVLATRTDLLADREDGPMAAIQDVKVAGDRLLVAGPAHSEGDVPNGILVVDVADPAAPEADAFLETGTAVHNCFLHDGVAYYSTGASGHRLGIADVAADEPRELATWGPTDHDAAWDDVREGVRPVHDVWVRADRAYVATWDAGTFVLDVGDPAAPAVVARVGGQPLAELAGGLGGHRFELPGNHHYVQPSADGSLLAVGMEAWNLQSVEGGRPGGVELWDVSTPSAPALRSTIPAERARDEGYLGGTWTTSHNFELAGDRLYTSWYQGGVKLFDVSDPSAPEQLAWWRDPAEAAFWTARPAAGDTYVASTTAAAGALSGLFEGLYVFPDRAGEQADPPRIPSPTPTPSATPSGSDARTPTRTATATPTPTGTPSDTQTAPPTERGPESPDENPVAGDGFGPLAALAALAGAAWWRRRG